MRIAIDLTALDARPSGVGRYQLGLVSSLARLDQVNEYHLFINYEDRRRFGMAVDGDHPAPVPLPANFRVLPVAMRPRLPRAVFQQLVQPAMLKTLRIDVLHSPKFNRRAWRGGQGRVLTVHDMTSFLTPECHPRWRRGRRYESAFMTGICRSDLVSVPSAAVRNDILRLVPGVVPDRVRVIPSGVDDAFRPQDPASVQRMRERLRLFAPYILYVGNLEPRKNLPVLVEAYARLVAERGIPEHLVLAGQLGWSGDQLFSRLRMPQLEERIRWLGYVPEPDLPPLYAGARVFAFPSVSEGFGFPPLEAMATGVPVVSTRTSSLSENLAGAAALVPPRDAVALAGGIYRLLTDDDARMHAIAAGVERAAQFRWDVFGRRTLECYEDVHAIRRRSRSFPIEPQPSRNAAIGQEACP